jgi:hypothetical protein
LGKSTEQNQQKGINKTYVQVSMGKELKNLQIAVLISDRSEVQPLDLYLNISQDITISVKGKCEVHLSGYFEPNSSMDDQMMFPNELNELEDDEEGEDEEEESDEDEKHLKNMKKIVNGKNGEKGKEVEGFKKGGDLDKSLKAANKNTMKNSMEAESDSDDDDDDDDDEEGEFDTIPGLDLEAEEGEDEYDEEINSSDEEDDEVLKKLQSIKNKQM